MNSFSDIHAVSGLFETHPLSNFSDAQYYSCEKIESLQFELLKKHLEYCSASSPFYKKLFKDSAFDPLMMKSLADIEKIPCTEKSALALHSDDFLAIGKDEIADVCMSSATVSSEPTLIFQSQNDLARLVYNEELAFRIAGVTPSDTLLVAAALDRCFMAGLAYFMGSVKLGARTVRGGPGSAANSLFLIEKTSPDVLVGVPSFFLKVGRYALENGKNPKTLGIRKIIAIGEALRDSSMKPLPLTLELEKIWGAKLFSTYASSELATSFCECESGSGAHLRPELIVLEILDDNGRPLPHGVPGEIVVTPLGVTGMPLVRFRTGDISFTIPGICPCGRNTLRLGPVLGRKNQMIKYKGTSFYPNMLIAPFEGHPAFHGGLVELSSGADGNDRVVFYVSLLNDALDPMKISDELRSKIRVVPEIVLISPEELDRRVKPTGQKRKKITFVDLRKNKL